MSDTPLFLPTQSENINEVAAALAVAQGAFPHATKDANGQARGGTYGYATLAAVMDVCREPLARAKLSYVQVLHGERHPMLLETRLLHASGQWIASFYPVSPLKDAPQDIGSALTYARRYSLMAMLGIAPADDDDGKLASTSEQDQQRQAQQQQRPQGQQRQGQQRSQGAQASSKQAGKAAAQQDKPAVPFPEQVGKLKEAIMSCKNWAGWAELRTQLEALPRKETRVLREAWTALGHGLSTQLGNALDVVDNSGQFVGLKAEYVKAPEAVRKALAKKYEEAEARVATADAAWDK